MSLHLLRLFFLSGARLLSRIFFFSFSAFQVQVSFPGTTSANKVTAREDLATLLHVHNAKLCYNIKVTQVRKSASLPPINEPRRTLPRGRAGKEAAARTTANTRDDIFLRWPAIVYVGEDRCSGGSLIREIPPDPQSEPRQVGVPSQTKRVNTFDILR